MYEQVRHLLTLKTFFFYRFLFTNLLKLAASRNRPDDFRGG